MTPRAAFELIALIQLAWLLAQWWRKGFLSAVNLLAYAGLSTAGYMLLQSAA